MTYTRTLVMDNLLPTCATALLAAADVLASVRRAVGGRVTVDGRIDGAALEVEQFAAHGLAWTATYVEGLRQTLDWEMRLEAAGKSGELEQLIVQAAFGEYLNQIVGGIGRPTSGTD